MQRLNNSNKGAEELIFISVKLLMNSFKLYAKRDTTKRCDNSTTFKAISFLIIMKKKIIIRDATSNGGRTDVAVDVDLNAD